MGNPLRGSDRIRPRQAPAKGSRSFTARVKFCLHPMYLRLSGRMRVPVGIESVPIRRPQCGTTSRMFSSGRRGQRGDSGTGRAGLDDIPDDVLSVRVPPTLRRSREVTQFYSRKVTHQNGDLALGKCADRMAGTAQQMARGWDAKTLRAFGADEIATFTPCPPARFFAWVTLSEHKWVTSRERRGFRPVRKGCMPPPARFPAFCGRCGKGQVRPISIPTNENKRMHPRV